MVVRNYNNKNYIELIEDKLILHRFWGKRTLKRNKIRAAYMDNNNYISILYGSRVITYGVIKVKIEDEIILEEIIEKLNIEKIVFCPDKSVSTGRFIVLFLLWTINMVFNPSLGFIMRWVGIGIIIICLISLFYYRRVLLYERRVLIYDKNNRIIKISGMRKRVNELTPGSENYKLIEHKTMPAICTLKINKYNDLVIQTDIRYPKYYREELKELYKLSNN